MIACALCGSSHLTVTCHQLPHDLADALNTRRPRFEADITAHLHGTNNGYRGHGCRCQPCTCAATIYRARERQRRRITVKAAAA